MHHRGILSGIVSAAAHMTRELSCNSGDHVIVLHVHEFAHGRFGRIQVDCHDGEGEEVGDKIVSTLQAADVSTEGEIGRATYGHIAAVMLKAAAHHDAWQVVLGSSSRTDLPRMLLGSVSNRRRGHRTGAPRSVRGGPPGRHDELVAGEPVGGGGG